MQEVEREGGFAWPTESQAPSSYCFAWLCCATPTPSFPLGRSCLPALLPPLPRVDTPPISTPRAAGPYIAGLESALDPEELLGVPALLPRAMPVR